MSNSASIRYGLLFVFNDNFYDLSNKESSALLAKLSNELLVIGFTVNCAYGLYLTFDKMTAVMNVQATLSDNIPEIMKYIKHAYIFRVDEWVDATEILTGSESNFIAHEEVE